MALSNNITTRSYVAEHLRTPEEMAAYILRLVWRKPTTTPHLSQRRWAIHTG
ncbi:MAG: hypothetical protein H0V90_11800 [Blastocatellia bacterium]|nr:hypothetical protein [Blastocatellia bacterium]